MTYILYKSFDSIGDYITRRPNTKCTGQSVLKKNCCKSRGAHAPVPHRWRRQWFCGAWVSTAGNGRVASPPPSDNYRTVERTNERTIHKHNESTTHRLTGWRSVRLPARAVSPPAATSRALVPCRDAPGWTSIRGE